MRAIRKGVGFTLALAFLALPLVIWWQYQAVEDWWRLREYTLPTEIAQLAETTTMTDTAKHIFYVNHPQLIEDVDTFRQNCPQAEQTIVLGCYHSSQEGIAIYDVQDPRLDGVEEVTAAHEMLHAAYERLSDDDKELVDGQLNAYAATLKDKRILETIDMYKKTAPENINDEMHSVFGTEVTKLPSDLEEHYSRYFADRAVVVDFAEEYEEEFSDRLAEIESYDKQLEPMRQQITAEEQRLRSELAALNSDRSQVNSSSEAASFNARVDAYNQAVRNLQADIATFNALLDKRNELAKEVRSLSGAIDTRLPTQTSE